MEINKDGVIVSETRSGGLHPDEKDNKKCPRKKCNGKIVKIFISNRSTFFCNSCQK